MLRFKTIARRFKRSVNIPSFVQEIQKSDTLQNYDVKWYNEPIPYTYQFDEDVWDHLTLPATHKSTLNLNGKTFYCIGESLGWPDFQDNPYRFHPMNSSFLYVDPESSTEKILIQLTKDFPPLLWIPVKPTIDALKRSFDEYLNIEGSNISKGIQEFDKMLMTISATDPEKKRNQLLERIDQIDPDTIKDEHPFTIHLFMGVVESEEALEKSLMNNPFLFNTPIIRGSTNKKTDKQVISSKFRTICSRSIITIDVRKDLYMDLEDGKMLPCFARINYPKNERMSKPCTLRLNKLFVMDYPEDVPIDVCAALLGNAMKGYLSIREEIKYGENENMSAINIAHLAILNDPEFPKIFDKFYKNSDSLVRLACLKGAAELGMRDKVDMLMKSETSPEILAMIERVLDKWNRTPVK